MKNVHKFPLWKGFSMGALVLVVTSAQGQVPLASLKKAVPAILSRSVVTGAPSESQILHLCVTLSSPNQANLDAFVKSVSNPSSPNYGSYLSPVQFGARFGQPEATFKKVTDYLISKGLTVKMIGDNHLSILADGTVAQAEATFHTKIKTFHSLDSHELGRSDFFSFTTPLLIPKNIAGAVGSVTGLENHVRAIPRFKRRTRQSGVTQPLSPAQTSVLYNLSSLHSSNYWGQQRTIGITSFDGFDLSNVSLFYSEYALPKPAGGVLSNISVVPIDDGPVNGDQGSGEGDLDQQMVLGQAPLAKLIVYSGGGDLQPVLAREAQDNLADIVTESYGWQYDASDAEAAHTLHQQLTAQGITYFLASGDDGTDIDGSSPPATYGDYDTELTNVGGTVATVSANGTRLSEAGWFGSAGGWVTTPVVPFNTVLPSWQHGTGVPTNIPHRLIPDVALHAAGSNNPSLDPGAYQFYFNGQTITSQGGLSGTSFASPVFAGAFALVESRLIDKLILTTTEIGKARLGRINDLIYAQNGRSDVWNDITSGSNGTLPNNTISNCTKGWDFVTGWGSTNFLGFANSFKAPPLVTIAPTSAQIYEIFGQGTTGGVANLLQADGKDYTINSVPTVIGALASPKYTFTLPLAASTLHSLTLTLVQNAPKHVTSLVYFYNYSTKLWNLENTTAMTGSNVTISVSPWNFPQMVSSTGLVTVVVRTVYPTSAGAKAFTLSTDQATLTLDPSAP